ncbi:hypothetical protein DL771_000652 [Monosporascus sp. 5C6A]|nr:hypothetical protein DL771_000652 [Monosporascus sp. 5C6A]
MPDNGKGNGKANEKNTAPHEPEATRRPVVPAEPRLWMTVRDFSRPDGSWNETTSPSGPPPYTWTAPASYTQSAISGKGPSSGWDEAYPVVKRDFSSPLHKVQVARTAGYRDKRDRNDDSKTDTSGKDKTDKDEKDKKQKGFFGRLKK